MALSTGLGLRKGTSQDVCWRTHPHWFDLQNNVPFPGKGRKKKKKTPHQLSSAIASRPSFLLFFIEALRRRSFSKTLVLIGKNAALFPSTAGATSLLALAGSTDNRRGERDSMFQCLNQCLDPVNGRMNECMRGCTRGWIHGSIAMTGRPHNLDEITNFLQSDRPRLHLRWIAR